MPHVPEERVLGQVPQPSLYLKNGAMSTGAPEHRSHATNRKVLVAPRTTQEETTHRLPGIGDDQDPRAPRSWGGPASGALRVSGRPVRSGGPPTIHRYPARHARTAPACTACFRPLPHGDSCGLRRLLGAPVSLQGHKARDITAQHSSGRGFGCRRPASIPPTVTPRNWRRKPREDGGHRVADH